MCGRFAQTNIIKATSDIVKTVIGKVENIDNFNISPGQEAAVIKKYSNGRALELATFSIFPNWAQDKEGFRPLHNTRFESLTTKPYFELFRKNPIIYDVIVDNRPESDTYLSWYGAELSDKNNLMMYVPKGFLHGYLTLSEKFAMVSDGYSHEPWVTRYPNYKNEVNIGSYTISSCLGFCRN